MTGWAGEGRAKDDGCDGREGLPLGKYGLRHEIAGASNMQPLHALCTRLQAQSQTGFLFLQVASVSFPAL